MKQNTDRSAADQDEKPERVRHCIRLERIQRHIRREVNKIRYQQPRHDEEFPERVLTLIQQGG